MLIFFLGVGWCLVGFVFAELVIAPAVEHERGPIDRARLVAGLALVAAASLALPH